MDFKHVGATALLTTFCLGVVGFVGVMVINNAMGLATLRESKRGLRDTIIIMGKSIDKRLDKIEEKQDAIILRIGNAAKNN